MATSTIFAPNTLTELAITLDSSKAAVRSWGRLIARRQGNLLIVCAHGLYTLAPIANETSIGTIANISNVNSVSVPVKVDGQSEPGVAVVGGNTLRVLNIQNGDRVMYFTIVVPLY